MGAMRNLFAVVINRIVHTPRLEIVFLVIFRSANTCFTNKNDRKPSIHFRAANC